MKLGLKGLTEAHISLSTGADEVNTEEKMYIELLKLKAFLMGEVNRHALAVNTRDVLEMVNKALEKKDDA